MKNKNPYKVGDWVVLKTFIKDGYGDIWHEEGEKVQVKRIAPDGNGLMFSSDLGIHWKNVKRANRNVKISKFEKKFGEVAFVKVCLSVLNHVLVDKGIVTEKELKDLLDKQIDEYEN